MKQRQKNTRPANCSFKFIRFKSIKQNFNEVNMETIRKLKLFLFYLYFFTSRHPLLCLRGLDVKFLEE